MEFKIRKDEFLRGLYLAHGIADRKSTLPILANVLLRTDGKDKLLCGATDLNVTTLVTLSAKIEKEGGLTVGARQLYEIVKGLPGDEVYVRALARKVEGIEKNTATTRLLFDDADPSANRIDWAKGLVPNAFDGSLSHLCAGEVDDLVTPP